MKIAKFNQILYFILAAGFLLVLEGCKDSKLPGPEEDPGAPELTEVIDFDGNVYNVIKICDQYWIQENLKVTHFNDGTPLSNITENEQWARSAGAAYSWYDNNHVHKDVFGALYNRAAAHSGNLCPTGWRVPSKEDFNYLVDYAISMGGYIGNSLREEGYDHWESPYPVLVFADNKTGFSARGGGMRTQEGEFTDLRKHGYWWHSEGHLDYTTWARRLDYNTYLFPLLGSVEDFGFSGRCVKSE